MLLKAAVSWPISSRVVTSIEPSRRPASTARVPSRSRRTGRVMPVLMKSEDISLLVTHRRQGIAANLRQHVRADIFDPLVEFVAQRVGPGQACPGFRDI